MNAVGIDVSKGKSMVAIVQHFGVVVAEPFKVSHDGQALSELVERVKRLPGEAKAVMEYTGTYYEPIANALHNAGIFVSVVNPLLIDGYGTTVSEKSRPIKRTRLKSLITPSIIGLNFVSTYPQRIRAKRLKSSIGNILSTTKYLSCRRII